MFTTHTPVPAGIDRFPMDLVEHYLGRDGQGGSKLVPGVGVGEVLALGVEDDPSRFNMAHMGLRLAQRANGVAKLHGVVSREMFAGLYPGFAPEEVPIGSVTNGVHLPTWASREMYQVAGDMANWQDLASAGGVAARGQRLRRAALGRCATRCAPGWSRWPAPAVKKSWLQRGRTEAELGWTDSILDPDILTIGFARRVSTYKRLTLMLRDPERLRALLLDPERPLQIIVAGKAHPADDGGKGFMQEMVRFTDDPSIRHRITFLPDYDMSMASVLCAGADVWLNNPIRPQEASGTSGMKAALNGGLNLSISDGWWDELYDGHDGWMIPTADGIADHNRRDDLEASALYDLLEKHVTRLFYDRSTDDRPGRWVEMVRHTLSYLGPRVQATRMVRDYVQQYYAPAAVSSRQVLADDFAPAKAARGLEGRRPRRLGSGAGDQRRHLRHRRDTVAGQHDDRPGARRPRWAVAGGRQRPGRHRSGGLSTTSCTTCSTSTWTRRRVGPPVRSLPPTRCSTSRTCRCRGPARSATPCGSCRGTSCSRPPPRWAWWSPPELFAEAVGARLSTRAVPPPVVPSCPPVASASGGQPGFLGRWRPQPAAAGEGNTMGSSVAHLVGNVATELRTSLENQGHERVSFRLIATERRRDAATGSWVDGDEFAVTVVCWGTLARNVAQSVRLGDPLMVAGRLTTRRFEADGETKYLTELRAIQLGHDLSRGRSVFSRASGAAAAAPLDGARGRRRPIRTRRPTGPPVTPPSTRCSPRRSERLPDHGDVRGALSHGGPAGSGWGPWRWTGRRRRRPG